MKKLSTMLAACAVVLAPVRMQAADVFTTAGVMVRQGVPFASATEGLDHGIYIVRTAGAAVKVAR